MNNPDHAPGLSGKIETAGPLVIAEFVILFIAAPLAFFFNIVALPKIPTILVVSVYALYRLLTDPAFDRSRLADRRNFSRRMGGVLGRFILVCAALSAAAWVITPDTFLEFPEITLQWAGLLIVYAVFSAVPQEIVYRAFFFHRYRHMFQGRLAMIAASTALFSYMHIVYGNWVAVALTFTGGIMFSRSYDKTRSLLFASIEHGLYGCACFVIGFGRFFM